MKGMIFAAGMGTRLKPITDTLPKALVPVGGKPLLEHVIRRFQTAGISEIVVNVHHFAEKIEEWIDAGMEGCVDVKVSDERALLLETGGAVLHARPLLEGCGRFLIHNVDILSDCDLRWFMDQVRPESLATLLVSPRKSSRYLLFDPRTMRLVGWKNENTGEIRSPGTSDPSRCHAFAFSGIHIMSDKVFELMECYAKDKGMYLASESPRFSVIDFYLEMCTSHDIYGVCAEDLQMVDVGKLDTLAKAEEFLKKI